MNDYMDLYFFGAMEDSEQMFNRCPIGFTEAVSTDNLSNQSEATHNGTEDAD